MQRAGYDFHMVRGADDFFLVARNRSGVTMSLSSAIVSMTWDESLDDVVTSGTLELDNSRDTNGYRLSQLIGKGTELILMVRNPVTGRIEEKDRFIVWGRNRGGMNLSLQIFDHAKYLAESKVTVLYTKGTRETHWDACEITKDLCKQYGIELARLPRKALKDIPYFYQEEQPLLDILIRLWTLESEKSNQAYVLKVIRGRLHIITKAKNPKSKVLELSNARNDSGILGSVAVSDSLDGVATVVRLWGTGKDFSAGTPDSRRAVVKSKQYAATRAVGMWGRIYYEAPVEGITTQADIDKRAKETLMKKVQSRQEASVQIIGFPSIRAGAAIKLHEPEHGIDGLYWFRTLSHSINGSGEYAASGVLNSYNYTKELATDPSDLKPDPVEASGSSGSFSLGDLDKQNAIPTDVWLTLRAAAGKAGVPEDWANSKSLEKLLQGESGFRWNAQNPSSTAYGLFQFLDTTWSGYGVTKEQASPGYMVNGKAFVKLQGKGWVAIWKYNMCVAGLRYIKQRYGTPEKAYAFWQAQSPHWY